MSYAVPPSQAVTLQAEALAAMVDHGYEPGPKNPPATMPRAERLEENQVEGFHQTGLSGGVGISSSKQLHPGKNGIVGAGRYFADAQTTTNSKARDLIGLQLCRDSETRPSEGDRCEQGAPPSYNV
jgi:hypothetical protein